MGVIVVGVDFSEGAKAALRFGLAEAKLRHATLRVVHAWRFDYIGMSGIEGFYPTVGPISVTCAERPKLPSKRFSRRSSPTKTRLKSYPLWSRVRREPFWSGNRRTPNYWWSAPAGTEASPGSCWDLSVSNAPITRPAP